MARAWTRRDDFVASLPADAHVLLDPQAGAVQFGDGAHIAMPRIGAPSSCALLRRVQTPAISAMMRSPA